MGEMTHTLWHRQSHKKRIIAQSRSEKNHKGKANFGLTSFGEHSNTKMESTLFVPVNLSFSENLRCLKMPLLVGAISQKRWPSETCFVFAGQNVNSGKFKHLKYSENVKFTGTNYIDSILAAWEWMGIRFCFILIIILKESCEFTKEIVLRP